MMRVVGTYVNVANPHYVEAIVRYRSWDEASADWGNLWKEHISHFGPINEGNLNAARSYVRSFQIGDVE